MFLGKGILLLIIFSSVLGKNIFFEQGPIIETINQMKTSWEAGHNSYFDGKTLSEIEDLMGALDTP